MPYIHCAFTLDLTDGAALTPGPVHVVPTIRTYAVYGLDIHTRIDGGCELTHGTVPIVPPKRPNVIKNFEILWSKSLWKIDIFIIFHEIFQWFLPSAPKVLPLEYKTKFLQQFLRFRGGGAFPCSPSLRHWRPCAWSIASIENKLIWGNTVLPRRKQAWFYLKNTLLHYFPTLTYLTSST